ncbi:MAG: hypothetical protein A2133_11540 [Actinobacteria bacterium RBG_16_64_13]|nr:MAG: hypothetical protein A2133_11540 [Actinobacteria bacterium RBG_16_64_13]
MKALEASQTVEFEQATSNRRLGARFVDVFVAVFVLLPLSFLILAPFFSRVTADVGVWTSFGVWIVLVVAYDTVMHRLLGKTLGKMLLGMQVVDARGKRIGWGRSLLRAVSLFVSIVVVVFGFFLTATLLGWVILRALPQHPRLPHDKAAKCFVVKAVKGGLAPVAAGTAAPGTAKNPVLFPDLERLRDQGIISEEEYQRKRHEVGP